MAAPDSRQSASPAQPAVALQTASYATWDEKYRLRDSHGTPLDRDPDDTLQRVARGLAEVEHTPEKRAHWEQKFLWALRHGAIPAGRILANAGASDERPAVTLTNCTVSAPIEDSMDSILTRLHEAGLTLKAGAGIGYEFSTLRPRGAHVTGAGAQTSGPLSFMDIFDRMCSTISSAGGRRGAQMATFDVGHPDIVEIIEAKREHGRLRQFNVSVLITAEFLEAVKQDREWLLAFPLTAVEADGLDLNDPAEVVWRNWPITTGYITNEADEVACRVHGALPARELWNLIMRSAYEYAEPGFILIDRYNAMNNNWFCETIRATNPCGEQGLPPNGCCLLGSVDLTRFVHQPFTAEASFAWDAYREVIAVLTRMLDNAVDQHGLPLPAQRDEILRKRRHGIGYLGLGSALACLGLRYGSNESLEFTERASRELALTGWQVARDLAREKGPAPIMEEIFEITPQLLARCPALAADGYAAGDTLPGKVLHARYSRYMQQVASVAPELVDELAEVGARFTHHSSIAPTGTISLSLANNASNGIEPSFAHHYKRNVIRAGRKAKESVDVYSYEYLLYRHRNGSDAELPDYFVTSDDIIPEEHLAVQASAQQWIDSSISKTINVPTDCPFDAFQNIYSRACELGLKGCTTFRFNPETFQGVLVRERDLDNTTYRFTLADGTVVTARGSDTIEYEGQTHTAANLHDALKEGYYGTF